jgi:hypothetical protein
MRRILAASSTRRKRTGDAGVRALSFVATSVPSRWLRVRRLSDPGLIGRLDGDGRHPRRCGGPPGRSRRHRGQAFAMGGEEPSHCAIVYRSTHSTSHRNTHSNTHRRRNFAVSSGEDTEPLTGLLTATLTGLLTATLTDPAHSTFFAKVRVAGSNPVVRSKRKSRSRPCEGLKPARRGASRGAVHHICTTFAELFPPIAAGEPLFSRVRVAAPLGSAVVGQASPRRPVGRRRGRSLELGPRN